MTKKRKRKIVNNHVSRVYSGSRPTGRLHLGNYLGGVKGYIALQEKGNLDCIYGVVDLHGITTPYESKTLQQDIREVVLDYLGAGLDSKKCHLMIQSQIPEHVELAYLFSTIYPVSRLEQLPTYKERKTQFPKYVNLGLLYYPILMAADILIYKAELVPVGIDQEPHLEVTREIARKFNRMFPPSPRLRGASKPIFPEPQRFATPGENIPSLTGEGKMSKTVEGSYILLTDDLKIIKEKLAKVPTDTGRGKTVPKEGGVANLLLFVKLFMGKKAREEYERKYLGAGLPAGKAGIKYQELKEKLAQAIYKELEPIQKRRKYFEEHPEEVDKILEEGRKYCSKIAKQTLREAKKAMGLV
jgi:tryptophanyl-tRNA synthetase